MKKERGITLIALVVTIVVMLILAGVTINLVFSPNGIIAKAKDAKDAVQNSITEDQILLNELAESMNSDVSSKLIIKVTDLDGILLGSSDIEIYSDSECTNLILKVTTTEDGVYEYTGTLKKGKYYVKVPKVPAGYSLPGILTFEIVGNKEEIWTIKLSTGELLPSTGGFNIIPKGDIVSDSSISNGKIDFSFVKDYVEETPVFGIQMRIYCVADWNIKQNTFEYTSEFSECNLGKLKFENLFLDSTKYIANQLKSVAEAERLVPVGNLVADLGKASIELPASKCYLIVFDEWRDGNVTYNFLPFLLPLPLPKNIIDNTNSVGYYYEYEMLNNIYDMPTIPSSTDISKQNIVLKWDDSGNNSSRPPAVSVNLLRDGEVSVDSKYSFSFNNLPEYYVISNIEESISNKVKVTAYTLSFQESEPPEP